MGSSARMDRSARFIEVFQEMFQKAICVKDKLPEGAVKFEGLYFNGGYEDVRYTVVLNGRNPGEYVDLDHECGVCFDPDASIAESVELVLANTGLYDTVNEDDPELQEIRELFVKADLM